MGVNLPAHLVVIKSTQYYGNGGYQDYSDSQILQMIGRAGRPQFDTSAVAVIMTKASCKVRYRIQLAFLGYRNALFVSDHCRVAGSAVRRQELLEDFHLKSRSQRTENPLLIKVCSH